MFKLRNLLLQLLLSAGWLVLATHSSVAQDNPYPSRAVRIIVPFAAGGPTDIAARLVADKLSKAWGQSVVVESRPGGGSMIGSAAVAQSSPGRIHDPVRTEFRLGRRHPDQQGRAL